jgi:S-adenosylmethionine hydrolase
LKSAGIITLLTDFGVSDPYVGIMKGVILSINPTARIIDITHRVRHGHITEAAFCLADSYHFFPKATTHVVVVDPGVGGKRRPILIATSDYAFVGPDNGLFEPVFQNYAIFEVFHLTKPEYFLPDMSGTFHGRDIFAPVSSHLSLGIAPSKMGPRIDDPVRLKLPRYDLTDDTLIGQVIRVDHFGNLITSLRREEINQFLGEASPVINIAGVILKKIHRTYAEVPESEMLALFDSVGRLEIAVNMGRAGDRLQSVSGNIRGASVVVSKGTTLSK